MEFETSVKGNPETSVKGKSETYLKESSNFNLYHVKLPCVFSTQSSE